MKPASVCYIVDDVGAIEVYREQLASDVDMHARSSDMEEVVAEEITTQKREQVLQQVEIATKFFDVGREVVAGLPEQEAKVIRLHMHLHVGTGTAYSNR